MRRKEKVEQAIKYLHTLSLLKGDNTQIVTGKDLIDTIWHKLIRNIKVKPGSCLICWESSNELIDVCDNGHTLCQSCFTHWYGTHDTCPYCRETLKLFMRNVNFWYVVSVFIGFNLFVLFASMMSMHTFDNFNFAVGFFIIFLYVFHFCLNWSIFNDNFKLAVNFWLLVLSLWSIVTESLDVCKFYLILIALRVVCTGKVQLCWEFLIEFCK